MNRLEFAFASDGDFEAVNTLRSGLSVSAISRFYDSGRGTARISGLSLHLRTGPVGLGKCRLYSYHDHPMILETSLSGTTGMQLTNGDVILDPNNRAVHTITGGFDLYHNTMLAISEAWHLGAISNSVTLFSNAELRFDAPIEVAIPISAAEGGQLNTNTSGTVTLAQFVTGGETRKTGPGTLSVTGSGSQSQERWLIQGGTLVAQEGSIDSARITIEPGTTLRLASPATTTSISNRGVLDIDGFVLEVGAADFTQSSTLIGDGELRVLGPYSRLTFLSQPAGVFNGFTGVLEAYEGIVEINQLGLDSSMTLRANQPSSRFEFSSINLYRVGAL